MIAKSSTSVVHYDYDDNNGNDSDINDDGDKNTKKNDDETNNKSENIMNWTTKTRKIIPTPKIMVVT